MFMTELVAGGGNPRDVLAAASRRPSIHPSHQGLFFHIVSATMLPQTTPALEDWDCFPSQSPSWQLSCSVQEAGREQSQLCPPRSHWDTSSSPSHQGYAGTVNLGTWMRYLSSGCITSSPHRGVLKRGRLLSEFYPLSFICWLRWAVHSPLLCCYSRGLRTPTPSPSLPHCSAHAMPTSTTTTTTATEPSLSA